MTIMTQMSTRPRSLWITAGTTSNAIHISPRWGYRLHVGVTFVVTLSRKHQFLPKVLDCVRLLWITDQLNYP